MKKLIVALRDSAAKVYGNPFIVQAASQAIRSLSDEVNKATPDNDISRHPSDFELHHVGYFEEDSGVVEPVTPSTLLARAQDLKNAP